MFCSECGKKIKNDVKFCPFCGQDQLVIDSEDYKSQSISNLQNFSNKEIKSIYEYNEAEFNELDNYSKRRVILFEISNTNPNHWTFKKLNDLLIKFDEGFFKHKDREKLIYRILREEELLSTISTTKEKSFLEKSFHFLFVIWIMNTIVANFLPIFLSDNKWEGWYIPGLSEITPVIVQEVTLFGEGEFRLASQAEFWRTNRRFRQIKDVINQYEDFDLNEFQNNLNEFQKNLNDLLE